MLGSILSKALGIVAGAECQVAKALADKAQAVTLKAAAVKAAEKAALVHLYATRAAVDRAAYLMKAAFIFRCPQWRRTRPRRFRTASHQRRRASLFEEKIKAMWIAKWEHKYAPLREYLDGLG